MIRSVAFMRLVSSGLLLLLIATASAAADRVVDRVDPSRTVRVRSARHAFTAAAYDRGPADPAVELRYASVILKPDASLDAYLADLQNPASPNYRRWLTPEPLA